MPPASLAESGAPVWPHPVQVGVASTVDPRATNSAASRPSTGGAPAADAPAADAAGLARSPAARLRSTHGLVTTASTAAAMTRRAAKSPPRRPAR